LRTENPTGFPTRTRTPFHLSTKKCPHAAGKSRHHPAKMILVGAIPTVPPAPSGSEGVQALQLGQVNPSR
jgi:hypothetical protein